MVYDQILSAAKLQDTETDIELSLTFDHRERVVDGKKRYLCMALNAWPCFDHMMEHDLISFFQIANVAKAGMRDFPQRGYNANFSAAVKLFYHHLVIDKS